MATRETSTRTRSVIWWGAAGVILLAGYADLARGGETIAALLLVAGYCVLGVLALVVLLGSGGVAFHRLARAAASARAGPASPRRPKRETPAR